MGKYTNDILMLILILLSSCNIVEAQSITARQFRVDGDGNTFYPVLFTEANWYDGATEFEISRPDVHWDASWWGSVVAKFRIHTYQWGHQSHFIDADIHNGYGSCQNTVFIADYCDATFFNGSSSVLIWLRGQTTYSFRSINSAMSLPTVYLGGYQQINGPFRSPTSNVNPNINQSGTTSYHSGFWHGNGIFLGNVGIGTNNPKNLLDVKGTIHAQEVKVDMNNWSDFVFHPSYQLKPLTEVEQFIKANGHLQDIPSATEVEQNGVNVGEMQKKLLQKVEETTLYMIEMSKQIKNLKMQNEQLKNENEKLNKKFKEFQTELKKKS